MSTFSPFVKFISKNIKSFKQYLSEIDNMLKILTLLAVLLYTHIPYLLWRDSNMHSIMQERPWIDSTPVLNEMSILGNGDVIFKIQFKLSNIGHSPAYKTWVVWVPVAYTADGSDEATAIKMKQREQCEFARDLIYDAQQFILPGKSTLFEPDNWFPIINKSSIVKNIDKAAAKLKKSLPHPYSEKSEVIPYTVFYVVGCVNYRFNDYDKTHQTSFAFRVEKSVKVDGVETKRPLEWSEIGTYNSSNVELTETSIGSFGS